MGVPYRTAALRKASSFFCCTKESGVRRFSVPLLTTMTRAEWPFIIPTNVHNPYNVSNVVTPIILPTATILNAQIRKNPPWQKGVAAAAAVGLLKLSTVNLQVRYDAD